MKSKVVTLYLTGLMLLFGLYGSANSQLSVKLDLDTVDIQILYTTAYPGTDTVWLDVQMRNPVPVAGYQFVFTLSNPDIAKFCQDGGSTITVDTVGIIIPPSPNYHTIFKICMDVCCIPDSMTDRIAYVYISPSNSFISDSTGMSIPFRYHEGEVVVWWSVPGDANNDSLVELGDLVFLISYLYRAGADPCVCEAADCDNNCVIDVGDVVYMVSYLYKDGPEPVPGCYSCPHENCWQ